MKTGFLTPRCSERGRSTGGAASYRFKLTLKAKVFKLIGLLAITLLTASLLLGLSGPATVQASNNATNLETDANGSLRAPGQLLLRVKPGVVVDGLTDPANAPAALLPLFNRLGVTRLKSLGDGTRVLLVYFQGSVDAAQKLASADPAIERADPNALVKLDAVSMPNDPLFQNGNQWWLDRIQARDAWQITTGSKSVKVGVSDDGIDANHPDLAGKVVAAYNFAEETAVSRPGFEGHATSVAGCIAANTNNGQGLAGLNWDVSLIDGKGFGQDESGFSFDLVRADIFAINQGARVVNNSWGGGALDPAILALADYAAEKGVVLVFSTGNEGTQAPRYPASLSRLYPNIIAVGATDINDRVVGFSNFGQQVSVVAPGSGIWTTQPGTGYRVINGTSFSAPIVTGVVALMFSVNPNLTPLDVRNILEGTADDISGVGFTVRTGYGRVNAYRAVVAAKNGDLRPGKQSSIQGRVSGVAAANVRMSLDPIGATFPVNPDGSFQIKGLGKATYRLRAVVAGQGTGPGPSEFGLTGAADSSTNLNFAFQNLKTSSAQADRLVDQARFFDVRPGPPPDPAHFFAQTGHTLDGAFQHYWEAHGGLAQFGYPLSEPFEELSATDGQLHTVQYFERNRMELHPENVGTDYEVLLGLLGQESLDGRTFAPTNPATSTGFEASGPFLQYWQSHGGLAQFGYPVSPVIQENGVQVQYFERNRFELHPENVGTDYEVLLGLLGRRLAERQGYLPN